MMRSLRPDDSIQKALLSTRSRLIGEYSDSDEPDLLVTHAWPQGAELLKSVFESAASQSFYVAAFRTEPGEKTVELPDYSYYGEFLAVHLSILYGKHFQFHGFLESIGNFWIPKQMDIGPTSFFSYPPFNHRPRTCVPTPLNLSEITRIRSILENPLNGSEEERILFTAGRFYNRALTEMERHPELAYLDLITCGEIISDSREVEQDRLYDSDLKEMFQQIEAGLEDGSSVVKRLRKRLYQVRSKFAALADLLDEYFFTHPETSRPLPGLTLTAKEIESSLKAAYDLRSQYVHTGVQFGEWVRANPQLEKLPGSPMLDDKKLKKILKKAPNLTGLERVMRYALLRVATEAGADLTDLYEATDVEGEENAR